MATSSARLPVVVRRRFYVGVSILMAVMALVGFWPSYFGPLLAGTVDVVPVLHFHATIYSGWLILFISQAVLAATGRIRLHRKLGQVGIYYGFALIPIGVFTAFSLFAIRVQAGLMDEARRGLLSPLTDMMVFPIFFIAAVLYRNRPEIHKRLMVVATTVLLIAAIGRMQFLGRPVPLHLFLLVWFLPIFAAMTYDYLTKRLIHPVYVIGLASLSVLRLRNYASDSDVWTQTSNWLAGLFA